ncbi:MAG: chorismate mutase [Candidatus Bathyarchaeia archaeon]|nr:chorismate mutase [Candidatus Bathyarchaeota archaeon]
MAGDELDELRRKIDKLNEEIMIKLKERVAISMRIGEVKSRTGRPIEDPEREARVIEAVGEQARRYGMDEEGVKRIFREIIRLCREAQMKG